MRSCPPAGAGNGEGHRGRELGVGGEEDGGRAGRAAPRVFRAPAAGAARTFPFFGLWAGGAGCREARVLRSRRPAFRHGRVHPASFPPISAPGRGRCSGGSGKGAVQIPFPGRVRRGATRRRGRRRDGRRWQRPRCPEKGLTRGRRSPRVLQLRRLLRVCDGMSLRF